MRIRQPQEFPTGYTPITAIGGSAMGGSHQDMLMDFGILRLAPGGRYASAAELERAFLLLDGELELEWEAGERRIQRRSLFDQPPWCLHLPAGSRVSFTAGAGGAELSCHAAANPGRFPAHLYPPEECASEERGKGTLRETSTRIVRTIFDDRNAPRANLVLGEVITYPGKWSSYPPHHHPQPEIYHYRFLPAGGFGLTAIGRQAYVLADRDTVLIREGEVHPQAAAPGYAMYYLWVIRHLEGRRYRNPTFLPEHAWTMKPEAKIWP
jgi:5-deoxy-glucuronate isomerase